MSFFAKPSRRTATLLVALAGLAFCLLFLEPSPWEIRIGDISVDQWCADAFYSTASHRWWVDADEPVSRLLFYTGPKALLIAASVALGLVFLIPGKFLAGIRVRNPWIPARRDALFITLCVGLIPLVCNQTKGATNIYCPYEHTRYGGHAPYVRLWDDYPESFKAVQRATGERGRGFPAGHASGGFALVGLAFTLRRRRWLGLVIGAAAGWWMGLYQMAKGAHYLNHTLVTWCVSIILAHALAWLVRPTGFTEDRPDDPVKPAA